MLRFLRSCWLLCSLFLAPHIGAQPRFDRPVSINRENGLPTNDVRAVCKDTDGFVWLATSDGLCRYDGAHIKVYRNDPSDGNTLFDNQILDVCAYRGKIWAATRMGISILDPSTERFANVQFDASGVADKPGRQAGKQIPDLFADPYGDMWAGTMDNGAVRYHPESGSFQFFTNPDTTNYALFSQGNNMRRIMCFAASTVNDSIIYAGTPSGLQEINRHTGVVRLYVFPNASPQMFISANAFTRLYCHDDGLLYTGSWRAGIQVFDPRLKTCRPLPCINEFSRKALSAPTYSILRKSATELWITTILGLAVYDITRREVTSWKEDNPAEGRYYGVNMIDENMRAWHINYNGVHIFDPCLQQFVTQEYKSASSPYWSYTYYLSPGRTDEEVIVLPFNDHHVYHFDTKTSLFQRFPLRAPGKHYEGVWPVGDMARAPDGTYTISSEYGLFSYDAHTHRLRPLPFRAPTDYFNLNRVTWDKKGRLWLCGSRVGLFRWNPATNETRLYQREFLERGISVSNPMIHFLVEDRRGQGWIRREDGFSVYVPDKDTIFNFIYALRPELSFPVVTAFAEDRHGRIWITGPDGWLGYAEAAHPEKGLVKKFNLHEQNGISDIYGLAADTAGNIWGYTRKELVFVDAETLRLQTLSYEYGPGEDMYYTCSFISDGRLALGGRNGITFFDPATMQRNAELPKPYIEEIQVQGKPLGAIPQIDGRPGLRLRHWENFFSINFSAKAYTLGDKCRFRYRLLGLEEWTEAGERRYANYTNVPGGDYIFQVQVANNEGLWSDALLEFPVYVDTAWWATWWFRGLALLSLSWGVYGVYRYRISRIRRQERVRADFEKKLASVEMSALLAQMNPHFLFNSLNSIDSYIIRNETQKASEYLNNFARLMRLILNNSRTNYISLKDELEALDLYLQMESLRFKDKFVYEIRTEGVPDTASINIPPMLIQPYIENAIWHGLMHKEGGGKVTLRVERQDDNLVCIVEDNGVGRARAMELRSKRDGSKRQSMGMQITEERIEIINKLYGANTRVQIVDLYDGSGEPAGTRVVLTIPI